MQTDKYIYWRTDTQLTWSKAQAACATIDHANLVSIHNFEESHIVESLRDVKTLQSWTWIGLRCTGNCSSFSDSVWVDGTPVDYTKAFYANHNSNCAIVYKFRNNVDYGNSDINDGRDVLVWDFVPCDYKSLIGICKVQMQ